MPSLILALCLPALAVSAGRSRTLPAVPGQPEWTFEPYSGTRCGQKNVEMVVGVRDGATGTVYLSSYYYELLHEGKLTFERAVELSRQQCGEITDDETELPTSTDTDTNVWNLAGGISNAGLHGGEMKAQAGGVSFASVTVPPPAAYDPNAPFPLPSDRPYARVFRLESAHLRLLKGGPDEEKLAAYLGKLKQLGIDTLIFSWADIAGKTGKGEPIGLKLPGGKDLLEVLFFLARDKNLGIYVGLSVPSPDAGKAIFTRYGASAAFRGWYLGPRSYCLDRDLAKWLPVAKTLRALGGEVVVASSVHATNCAGKHEALPALLKAQEGVFSAVSYGDGMEAGVHSEMKDGSLKHREKFGAMDCGKEICREKAFRELAAHLDRVAALHEKSRVAYWLELEAVRRGKPCAGDEPECPENATAFEWSFVEPQLRLESAKVRQRSHLVLAGGLAALDFGAGAAELSRLEASVAAARLTDAYRRYLARQLATGAEKEEKNEKRKPGVAYCTMSGSLELKNGKAKAIPPEYLEVGGDKNQTGPELAMARCSKNAQDMAAVACTQEGAKKATLGILIESLLPDGSTLQKNGKYERDCRPGRG